MNLGKGLVGDKTKNTEREKVPQWALDASDTSLSFVWEAVENHYNPEEEQVSF